jgi:DNA-binding response OmpR family regulator
VKVLVVDDESHICELAQLYLEKEGHRVLLARSGEEALKTFKQTKPDFIVLDVMLPGIDGYEVCKEIRRSSATPILMLTARGDDVDKIIGLELGADDYLAKPFNPREMVARVKAILRRADGADRAGSVIAVGPLTIDKRKREARIGASELSLRAKEFDLLTAFAENFGIVLSREQLLDSVWGYEFYGETRTVDVHVQHLRAKLASSGITIVTLRGVGYKLVEDQSAETVSASS